MATYKGDNFAKHFPLMNPSFKEEAKDIIKISND